MSGGGLLRQVSETRGGLHLYGCNGLGVATSVATPLDTVFCLFTTESNLPNSKSIVYSAWDRASNLGMLLDVNAASMRSLALNNSDAMRTSQRHTLGVSKASLVTRVHPASNVGRAAAHQGGTTAGARAPAFEEFVLDLQKDIKERAEAIEGGSGKKFIDDRRVTAAPC